MKAALYSAFAQPLEIIDAPDPAVPADGVVIRVGANGICRSDWHGWMGHDPDIRLPHVPGHEFAGEVVETGTAVSRFKPGDRVTVPFAVGCGRCPQCLAGDQHICDDYFQPGFTAWGSFAQYVAIPHADVNLVRLPDDVSYVTAASLGCRFITSFRAVVAQGRLAPGEWLVVHGCGGVGLSAIMIGRALGAQVIGVDIDEAKLAFAREMGATHALNAARQPELIDAIHDLSGGAHVALDALGSITTCRNSILSLRKRGRHVQVGLMVAEHSNPPLPMGVVIAKELEILGSHGMQAHAYGPLLEMVRAGALQPQRLVQQRIGLEAAPEALAAMTDFRGVGITVIDRF
jgi:alcohol dehydrogenase